MKTKLEEIAERLEGLSPKISHTWTGPTTAELLPVLFAIVEEMQRIEAAALQAEAAVSCLENGVKPD